MVMVVVFVVMAAMVGMKQCVQETHLRTLLVLKVWS